MSPHPLSDRYRSQPREVAIETLALCNAACIFCPYPTLVRQGVELDTMTLTHLIGQMGSWREPFFISPFKVNEPLLDKRLPEICQAIIDTCPAATLRLFTNGQPLAPKQIDWIQALPYGRVEHLWISLNSTNAQEYGRLMKCSFSIVLDHLNQLHTRVLKGEFKHTVVLSRVIQGGPQGQVLGDADCQFSRDILTRWPLFQTHLIKRDSWLGYVRPSDSRVPNHPCARWWELSITAEGTAVLCCMDGKGEYPVGNVHTQTLTEIYNSPECRRYREQKQRRDGLAPCASCSY